MTLPSVNINPNTNGLPGIVALEKIVGALMTFGLIAAVAGVALSAIAWAVGSHSANPHVAPAAESPGSWSPARPRCSSAPPTRWSPSSAQPAGQSADATTPSWWRQHGRGRLP